MPSQLMTRISALGQQDPEVYIVAKDYGTINAVPLHRVQIFPGTDVVAYDTLQPLIGPMGEPIAATGKGTWGQLYAAGRT